MSTGFDVPENKKSKVTGGGGVGFTVLGGAGVPWSLKYINIIKIISFSGGCFVSQNYTAI